MNVETFITGLHDYLGKAFAPVTARLNALEARLNVLEQCETKNLADFFRGSWLPATAYRRGDLIQHRGGAWICVEDGAGKPGESSCWRLLVQRGKDGKDATA